MRVEFYGVRERELVMCLSTNRLFATQLLAQVGRGYSHKMYRTNSHSRMHLLRALLRSTSVGDFFFVSFRESRLAVGGGRPRDRDHRRQHCRQD